MKSVLSFDVDQTLNVAKTPIPPEIAELLLKLLRAGFKICPISGQKFDQFLVQIVNPLIEAGAKPVDFVNLHLFVAQGTQYYSYPNKSQEPEYSPENWQKIYDYPLTPEQVSEITNALEASAKELGFWEEDKLKPGDEIIENRLSQITFSALGQKASTDDKYKWDPDCEKRVQIVKKAKALAPDFEFEIGGTTSINAFVPGMNKVFGINHLMQELDVEKSDILYFGDMTQPGGNDYPVVEMGVDTITVRSHEDTAFALRGILGVTNNL